MKKSRGHGLKFQTGPGHSQALHADMHKFMQGLEEEGENPQRGHSGTTQKPDVGKKVKKPKFQTKSKLFKETEEGGE